MSDERTPLQIADAENTYSAIMEMVKEFPDYENWIDPEDEDAVIWNGISEGTGIGIFPLQGAYYIKRYVSGSYVAQLPFQIQFKCAPTSNQGRMECQTLLNDLARWMEENSMKVKDEHISFESINRTSPVFGANQDVENTIYAVNMQLRFQFKK